MRINSTSLLGVNFKGRVIDYHTHTGNFFGTQFKKEHLDIFVKSPLPNGDVVEKMIVSDMDAFDGTKDEYRSNKKIYKEIKDDDRYLLMFACSPKNGSVKKVEKFIKKHPDVVKGLKIHPNSQAVPITDSCYELYFNLAEKYNLPCLFHTVVTHDETGKLIRNEDGTINKSALDEYSDPELIYEVAKKHPQIPFIMAHMGAGWRESHDRTIEILLDSVKNGDANLYCDISWVDIDSDEVDGHKPKDHIIKAIKALKGINDSDWKYGDQSFRLVFGTDAPIGRFNEQNACQDYSDFIEEIKYAIRNDEDLAKDAEQIIENLFYDNAEKLINMPRKLNNYKRFGFIKL